MYLSNLLFLIREYLYKIIILTCAILFEGNISKLDRTINNDKMADVAHTVAAGGGLAHPSVMACSWYMKLCRRVLFGWRPAAVASAAPPSPPNAPNPARLPPPPSESWNVAYGEMSSAVSVTHQRHCLPFKSRRANCFSRPSTSSEIADIGVQKFAFTFNLMIIFLGQIVFQRIWFYCWAAGSYLRNSNYQVPNLAIVRIITKVHLESCQVLHLYLPLVAKPLCVSWRSNAPAASQHSVDSLATLSSVVALGLLSTLANLFVNHSGFIFAHVEKIFWKIEWNVKREGWRISLRRAKEYFARETLRYITIARS